MKPPIGIFYSEELGPAESALAYAASRKQYDRFAALGTCAPPNACPANGKLVSPGPLAGLKQINPAINPLGLIPRVTFGSLQSNSQIGSGYYFRYPLAAHGRGFLPCRSATT